MKRDVGFVSESMHLENLKVTEHRRKKLRAAFLCSTHFDVWCGFHFEGLG